MRFNDILKLFLKLVKKNKRIFIITTIIIVFFSFLTLSMMSISMSYTKNLKRMNYEIIEVEGTAIGISISNKNFEKSEIDYVLDESSKYDNAISNIYAIGSYAMYYDYLNFDYELLKITNTSVLYRNSNYAFINSKDNSYSIDERINISGKEYIVGGYYESDVIKKPICDLTNSIGVDYRFLTIEYEIKNADIKSFGKLYDGLKKLEKGIISVNSYNYEKYLENNSKADKNNYLLLMFEIVFIIFMMGVVCNSFSILHMENKNTLMILRLQGATNHKVKLIEFVEYMSAFLISIFISFILILALSSVYKTVVIRLIKILNDNLYEELLGIYNIKFNVSLVGPLVLLGIYLIISLIFSFKLLTEKKIELSKRGE